MRTPSTRRFHLRVTAVIPVALCVVAFASGARGADPASSDLPDTRQATTIVSAPASVSPPAPVPAHAKSHPFKTFVDRGFGHLTALALPPAEAAPSTITKVSGQQIMVIGKSRFTDAPVPDDDDAPQDKQDLTSPSIRPSFFHRDPHQVGDALDGGSAANQQRRGHGQAAAGLALAIPLN